MCGVCVGVCVWGWCVCWCVGVVGVWVCGVGVWVGVRAHVTCITCEHTAALYPPPGLIEDLPLPLVMYRHGLLDLNTVVFYTLIWVVIHAVLQQYIWEVCVCVCAHTHTNTH